MLFSMPQAEVQRLLDALRADEDCAEAGDGSFTVDLFETDPPVTLELYPDKDGIAVTAAASMAFSEELDGWYMADRITDREAVAGLVACLRAKFLNA